MKDKIRKILREETEKQPTAYYLIVDKRTNTVMDPGLWRLGYEDSGGSAYGTWDIDFGDPKSVAQYSFKDMDEIEDVIKDIELEKDSLEKRASLDDEGKRDIVGGYFQIKKELNKAWNIQEEIDYYNELLQHLEVRGFKLAVEPIKVEDPFKKLFGYSPYDEE